MVRNKNELLKPLNVGEVCYIEIGNQKTQNHRNLGERSMRLNKLPNIPAEHHE